MDSAELTRMYDFTGRTGVVTGGTGGLGRAMGEALGRGGGEGLGGCGAGVGLLARNREKADALVSELKGPGRAVVFNGDATRREDLERAAREVVEEFGSVDCLLNGAGGNHPRVTTSAELSFFNIPEEAIRFVFDLNLLGTILPSQVFGRLMAERGEGVVLNVSSMSAVRPMTRVLTYSAAKAGVNNFTHWLAVHLATEYSPRIRVNAIAPGFFLTEQNRFLLTDRETGGLTPRGQSIIAHTPMGPLGEPAHF